ncbi:uncharacterized protein [Amphiura filiformis]|uniref:uncharacterized protein n=1 Tax=Amphiura filiformis TaxID=82378 RepID=UPI003B210305
MAYLSQIRSVLLVIFVSLVTICYAQDPKGFTNNPNALIAYIVLGVVLGIFIITFAVITCYICYRTRPVRQGWQPHRPQDDSPARQLPRKSNRREDDVEEGQERQPWSYRSSYDDNFFFGPAGNYYNSKHNKPTEKDKIFIIN